MSRPVPKPSLDDVRDQREEWELTLPDDAYLARVLAWADEMEIGDPGRAELLDAAGHAVFDEDPQRALELHQRAFDDGGPTTIDVFSGILESLLALGRDGEADELLRDLRTRPEEKRAELDESAIGEVLELADRLTEALRWYNIGLRHLEPELDAPDYVEGMCLVGRFRVRRALGRGLDSYDRLFEDLNAPAAAAIRGRLVVGSSD
jgi:hypothetical protein